MSIRSRFFLSNSSTFQHFPSTAEVDYVLERGVRIAAKPHMRGCLCNRRPCIRFCCRFGSVQQIQNETKTCVSNEHVNRLDTDIVHENNTKQSVKLGDHFSFVNDNPCKKLYIGDSEFQISHVRILISLVLII